MGSRRTFAGQALRALRTLKGLRQIEMAAVLGISPAYLSQIETDNRPITPAVMGKLRGAFPVEWQDLSKESNSPLVRSLESAFARDTTIQRLPLSLVRKFTEQFPAIADAYVQLAKKHHESIQRLDILDEALSADNAAGGRLPWEQVRDWFHIQNNYVDSLDRLAENYARSISDDEESILTSQLVQTLERQGTILKFDQSGPVRFYDPEAKSLTINSSKASESLRFHLCWHIASTNFSGEIANIAQASGLANETAESLLTIGLTNYMAGAILMPYESFRFKARQVRHDVDRLRHIFGSTFEQVCHRLSTLQRPDAKGIPMFFCRVDLAGNITKRHSATRLQFARFGGACPLWIVHEAAAAADRIHVQLAEMPNGVRYVSMAKGITKPTGSYMEPTRRYAVALGCEVEYAGEFIYARELNLANPATPIGASCRICHRLECDQRAFPPSDREIHIDAYRREILPYQFDPAESTK